MKNNPLLHLKDLFGIEEDGSLSIALSRQELSSIAGTTTEQVIRQLSDFDNERLIEKAEKKIFLTNEAGLRKIIAGHN